MQVSDKIEFVKVLNGISAIRRTPLTAEAMDLWWGCMADWTIEDFKTAALQVLKRSDFMPTPKDFEDLRKAGRMTAGVAWDYAIGHAASSRYREGPFGFAQIDQCVRMSGGYSAIAMCEEDKLHFLERRFSEHYETLDDAVQVREAVPLIAGHGGSPLKLVGGTFKRIGSDK